MLFLLLLVCSTLSYSNAHFPVNYRYIKPMNSFYKFHTHVLSWFDAKEKCEAEGAEFFYPKSRAELRAVTTFWRKIHDLVDFIYIGLSDFHLKGHFKAIGGEPNNSTGNEQCVISSKNGTLLDVNCTSGRAFICKKNSSEVECDTDYRSDYHYLEATNASYKFHTQGKPWKKASKECESEGAILFYPTNKPELTAVTNFWKETHSKAKMIYIGITDLAEKGKYESIDGGVAYIKWHKGEPNNAKGKENCVMSFNDGTFLDEGCSRIRAFICKRASNGCT